jgi:ABC-2 type transport system permease protein
VLPDAALPATGPVLVALYRLFLRTTATRGRLLAIGSLTAVSVLSALVARASGPDDSFDAGVSFVVANLTTLLPVAVLVFGAGAIGDLIDDGSLVYVWLRPIPARLPVLAAWAATVTIVLPLVAVPVVFGTALLEPAPELLGAATVALLVGTPTYAAFAVMAGIRFRRALPWGLAYILLWEGFVAGAGSTAGRLAVRSYLLSIVARMADHPIRLGRYTLATGVLVPLVVGALALAYASRRLARTDVA